ncbi:homeodomain transcription factor [Lithospermum erythrorhizon]|uniref:Homeodomain transcription factor n=1 Tax=Lithospermum erythrorhizon TaxID=34254 RepID=A0AAV3PVY5_LITER
MTGFPLHPIFQGETMDGLLSGMQISDYYRGSYMNSVQDMQFGRDVSQDFMTGGSQVTVASRFDLYENEQKLGTSDTAIAYPLGVAEDTGSNDYSIATQSIRNTLNCGYEGVPIDFSTRWDYNKIVDPTDLTGLVTRSTVLQSFQFTRNNTSNGWTSSENVSLSSGSPSASTPRFSNELSLTLATCQPSMLCRTGFLDQFSDISYSRISNHSLNNRHLFNEQTPCSIGDASSCLASNESAQLSQFFSGSSYLNVMQEILADFAHFSLHNLNKTSSPAIGTVTGANGCVHPSNTDPRDRSSMKSTLRDCNVENRKQLLDLLQVVDDQYNRLVDEIHKVISAFYAVSELDPQIHARFALQTVSFLYKNLRERISNHILAMGVACVGSEGTARDEKSLEISCIQKQWGLQQLKRKDQHLWRPQRGLPERSVSVLRAWMFQNFLHPYPKDAEKDLLAMKSGLTRGQVSNWFINARVRLWKPLIEEMYAEMSRRNDAGSRNLGTLHHGRYSIN